MFSWLLDFFFPRLSLSGTEGQLMTSQELRAMYTSPIRMERGELRHVGIKHLDRLVAASTYESSPMLRLAIRRFKYGRMPRLSTALAGLLVRALPMLPMHEQTVFCPVPLHWSRRFARGFNQSQLLVDELSVVRGLRVEQLLLRVRPTGHQAWRSRKHRLRAMRAAFRVVMDCRGMHVVLVDDIATTGATLDACAQVLKQAGAQSVQALVVAKG